MTIDGWVAEEHVLALMLLMFYVKCYVIGFVGHKNSLNAS